MTRRIGLAPLMALVAVLAVGLGAMKAATETTARLAVALAAVALLVGTLGALIRRPRAGWIGFSLFGWFYSLVVLGVPILAGLLPNIAGGLYELWQVDIPVMEAVAWVHAEPSLPARPAMFPGSGEIWRFEGKYHVLNGSMGTEVHVPPAEIKAVDAYVDQQTRQGDWFRSVARARQVGYALQGLIFALAGAAIGQALGRPTPSTPGAA